jgi:hypothetical protein
MKTLEITNTDEFTAIQLVADFGTLLGTYSRGFAVIIEPYDERLPHIPDPVLQLRCVREGRGGAAVRTARCAVRCALVCPVVFCVVVCGHARDRAPLPSQRAVAPRPPP